jgi:uncharacterized membrane protein
MHARALRGKRGRSSELGADRAVITVVVLAVTTVLLLIGFAGPSVYFTLPGPTGWLYIGIVIIAAASALLWLFYFDAHRKKGNTSGLKTVKPRSRRIPLR